MKDMLKPALIFVLLTAFCFGYNAILEEKTDAVLRQIERQEKNGFQDIGALQSVLDEYFCLLDWTVDQNQLTEMRATYARMYETDAGSKEEIRQELAVLRLQMEDLLEFERPTLLGVL